MSHTGGGLAVLDSGWSRHAMLTVIIVPPILLVLAWRVARRTLGK